MTCECNETGRHKELGPTTGDRQTTSTMARTDPEMESKQHSSSRDGGNIRAVRTRSNIIFQKNRRSRHMNALHLRRAAPRRRATGLGRLRRRSEAGSRAVACERPRRARGAGRQSGADADREAEQGAAEVAELLVAGSRRATDSPEPKALPQRRRHRRRTFRAPRDARTHRSSQRGRRRRKERCGRSAARHRVEVREALRRESETARSTTGSSSSPPSSASSGSAEPAATASGLASSKPSASKSGGATTGSSCGEAQRCSAAARSSGSESGTRSERRQAMSSSSDSSSSPSPSGRKIPPSKSKF